MTGAQMNASYAVALQLLDRKVTAAQFLDDAELNRPDLWSVIDKIECLHNPDFDAAHMNGWSHRVSISFGTSVQQKLLHEPRSQSSPVSNEEILEKWRATTEGILKPEERQGIELEVLNLERSPDVMKLLSLLLVAGVRLDAEDAPSAFLSLEQRVISGAGPRSIL